MIYTIRINDETSQTKSIIEMLKNISKDYNIEIYEEDGLTDEQKKELDRRLEMIENGTAKFISLEEFKSKNAAKYGL